MRAASTAARWRVVCLQASQGLEGLTTYPYRYVRFLGLISWPQEMVRPRCGLVPSHTRGARTSEALPALCVLQVVMWLSPSLLPSMV
jgi:hypothetical protein